MNNPAMDYATPIGFAYRAPADGVYRRLASNLSQTDTSAAGHLGELLIVGGKWDGYRIRFAHNDHHVAAHGARVERGSTVLAATGNTGYVRPRPTPAWPSAGVHVHTYGLTPDGDRWNWTLYADDPTTAGDGARPFEPEEDDMTQQDVTDIKNQLSALSGEISKIKDAIHDRRQTAILGIPGHGIYVVDFAGRTMWNVAAGQETVEAAFAFRDYLWKNLGLPWLDNQSPAVVAGLNDITGEKTVSEEVAAAIRRELGSQKVS
ncbi:M23 family metallopeptidase [Microbacterium sp. H37-C3]|uniref:M23 family metallopeptidase n=1 Tax=Microbacterium sp. H37-C3 TaxID=3004354 RepID=UPI0022AF0381|nr:M23 family metallopeptidase [Microbacterium sp. H37-C3]MCZ4069232.1 M23 family metallopeptidase [Microbacterium sp. H37-C3]